MSLQVYNASAGSGKTTTLITELLSDCLSKKESFKVLSSSLAITFTNDATKELKSRLLEYLKDIINDSNSTNAQLVYNNLKVKISPDDFKLKAQKLHSSIIHNYSKLSIFTNDAFASKLIRQQSQELGLGHSFQTLIKTSDLNELVVDNLLEKSETLKYFDHLLELFSEEINSGKPVKPESIFTESLETLSKSEYYHFLDRMDAIPDKEKSILFKDLLDLIKLTEKDLAQLQEEYKEFYQDNEELINDSKTYKYFRTAIQDIINFSLSDWIKYCQSTKGLNKIEVFGSTQKLFNKNSAFEGQSSAIYQALNQIGEKVISIVKKRVLALLYLKSLPTILLLSEVKAELNQVLNELNTVKLSDVYDLLNKASDDSGHNYLLEKAGLKYFNYYLDEFQDTSSEQWHLFRHLCDEALAKGGRVFIVGDPKQSIYTWRNARPEIFNRLFESKDATLNSNNRSSEKFNAGKKDNYRSGKNIVDFANYFLSCIPEIYPDMGNHYFENGQQIPHSDKKDYIKIDIKEAKQVDDKEREVCEYALETIKSQIEKGYQYQDIALLFRKKKEQKWVAKHLLQAKIPLIIEGSLDIHTDYESSLIINLLGYSACKTEEEKEFFRSKISLQLLENSRFENDDSSNLNPKSINPCFKQFSNTDAFGYPIIGENYLETIFELADALGFDKLSPAFQKLSDLLQLYWENGKNLDEALEQLNSPDEDCSISSPTEQNAVRLYTIHKSKGLGFKVVIIPYFHSQVYDKGKYLLNHELVSSLSPVLSKHELTSMLLSDVSTSNWTLFRKIDEAANEDYQSYLSISREEDVNNLYVAITRAKEKLFIQGFAGDPTKDKPDPYSPKYNYGEVFITHLLNNPGYLELGTDFELESNNLSNNSMDNNKLYSYNYKLPELKKQISTEQISHGNTIHKLLENIDLLSQNLSSYTQFPEIANAIEFLEELNLLNNNYEYLSEREWISEGEIIKPDLVVKKSENAYTVIDYKTGEENERHFLQLSKYKNAFIEMGVACDAHLLYLNPNVKKRITHEALF